MTTDPSDIGKRTAKGAGWTVLMRFAVRSVGIVSTLILARLLVPADFGLVALAMTLLALLEVMSHFNFEVFLVREPDTDRSHYDTAWTLTVLRGIAIAVLLVMMAPLAASFFNEPRLENVVYAIAALTGLVGFTNIGIVEFQKHLDFGKEFQLTVYSRLVSFLVTVILAFVLRSYWALVIGAASAQIVKLGLSYGMHHFRPRFSVSKTREIIRFSKWLLANDFIRFASNRADIVILGKFFDTATLGLYSIAFEIATLAVSEIVAPINRALLAGLSKLNREREVLLQAFIDSQSIIILLGLPIAAGIGLTADPLVRLALGEKWLTSIPLIQILAIVSIARVLTASSNPLILAAGQPHLTTIMALIGLTVGLPLLIWATAQYGVTGAAWAVSGTAIFKMCVTQTVVARAFDIKATTIFKTIWRPATACAVMSGVVWSYLGQWPASDDLSGNSMALVAASFTGAATYGISVLALWHISGSPRGAESRILETFNNATRQFWSRRLARQG